MSNNRELDGEKAHPNVFGCSLVCVEVFHLNELLSCGAVFSCMSVWALIYVYLFIFYCFDFCMNQNLKCVV